MTHFRGVAHKATLLLFLSISASYAQEQAPRDTTPGLAMVSHTTDSATTSTIPNTGIDPQTGYLRLYGVNPAFAGPPSSNGRCLVDGYLHSTIAACAQTQGGKDGARKVILDSWPEVLTFNPWRLNEAAKWHIWPGVKNATVCNSQNPNCLVTEVPLIFGPGSDVDGDGPVGKGLNFSQGSAIISGDHYPGIVGIPSLEKITCTGTGSLPDPIYIGARLVVNLQTNPEQVPTAGPSAYVKQTVTGCGGRYSLSIPVPKNLSQGSLPALEYQVGYDKDGTGNYATQLPGSGMTCVKGSIDAQRDCTNAGGPALLTSLQTGTDYFDADEKTGQPVDQSNALINLGPNASVSFSMALHNLALITPQFSGPPGEGGNPYVPNVMVRNISGQEHTGTDRQLTIYGNCGGYQGVTGVMLYSASQTPNSAWQSLQIAGGTKTGDTQCIGILLDGRGNTSGSASGAARKLDDWTCALRDGATHATCIEVQGFRSRVQISNGHLEINNGNDAVFITDGARVVFTGVEGFTTGNLIHLSATAGEASGSGLCAQGTGNAGANRCDPNFVVVKDDTDPKGKPQYGYLGVWASAKSRSVFGHVEIGDITLDCQTTDVPGHMKCTSF